jgi:hypothetical protein
MTNLPAPIAPGAEPALRSRRDGWTPDRQRRFIEALANCGGVGEAAARAGMTKQSAYKLRRHPAAADFRAGWDAALGDAWRRIEETALERAIGGETETYDRDGIQITRHRPCAPQLLINMLDRAERARKAARASADREAATVMAERMRRLQAEIRCLATGETPNHKRPGAPKLPPPETADAESIALRDFAKVIKALADRSDVDDDSAKNA